MSSASTQATILALLQASAKALEAAMALIATMPMPEAKADVTIPQAEATESQADAASIGWPEEVMFADTFVPIEVEVAVVPEAAAAATVKKDKRIFTKLSEALPFGTTVSITSLGEAWKAVYTEEGFKMGDLPPFKSPMAFGRAHANRITEIHPKETKPGNGWEWIKIDDGEHIGKSIGQVYNEHFAN